MKKPSRRAGLSSAKSPQSRGTGKPPARPSNRTKNNNTAASDSRTSTRPARPKSGDAAPSRARSTDTPPPRRSRVTGTRTFDLMDPTEPQRLSKIMAAKGMCSRREADYLIEKGWVRVNGKAINELGFKCLPSATIDLDSRAKTNLSKQVTILYHKPIGIVSGQPEGRYKAAMEMISSENQFDRRASTPFSPAMLKGLAPAGRLDIDSTGLLVLTQDGRIARQLIDESSTIDKEYLVRVEGELSPNGMELLRFGLSLDGKELKPARVSWLNEDQLKFVLVEGKKRQIRRMCEMVGLKVTGLKRIRMGRIMLGDLPPGQWRLLRADEQF